MLPYFSARADSRTTDDFLKIDNDFVLSKSGLKVETILFDRSTNGSRSKNLLTFIFGRVMEWRAKNWIKNYVEKNKDYLPGADKFLKNINSAHGVKRSEVLLLLARAKIARSPIFSIPEKNTTGLKLNYFIKDTGESVIDFLVKSIDPAPSRDAVKIFFNFLEKGSSAITHGNTRDALDFLDNFRKWSEKNSEENLVSLMRGNVNLFRSSLVKKISEFKQTDNLVTQDEKINYIKNSKNEENIRDAFKTVLDEDKKSKLFSYGILANFGRNSISDFLGYVKNGASSINFSNIEKLESWVNSDAEKFIDGLSIDNQYLVPSLQVVVNQLKIDIQEFRGDSYKVAVDRPAFLPPKISADSDDDAW